MQPSSARASSASRFRPKAPESPFSDATGYPHSDEVSSSPAFDSEAYTFHRSLLAVTKVIHSWEAEVRRASEVWSRKACLEADLGTENTNRWRSLFERLDSIQERLDGLERREAEARPEVEERSREQRAAAGAVLKAVEDLKADSSKSLAVVGEILGRSADDVKSSIAQLLAGGEERVEQSSSGKHLSLGRQVQVVQERVEKMGEALGSLDSESRRWREMSDLEVAKAQEGASSAMEELQRLKEVSAKLREELRLSQERIPPVGDALRAAAQVASRGNAALQWSSGKVDVRRTVEFAPCSIEDPPEAKFSDPESASGVAADVAELLALVGAPVLLETELSTPAKAPSDFGEKLAESQAKLFKDLLVRSGVPEHLIATRGRVSPAAAPKGKAASGKATAAAPAVAVATGLSLQLDSALFSAKLAKAKSGRDTPRAR